VPFNVSSTLGHFSKSSGKFLSHHAEQWPLGSPTNCGYQSKKSRLQRSDSATSATRALTGSTATEEEESSSEAAATRSEKGRNDAAAAGNSNNNNVAMANILQILQSQRAGPAASNITALLDVTTDAGHGVQTGLSSSSTITS